MRRTSVKLGIIAIASLVLVGVATLGPFGIKGAIHDTLDSAVALLNQIPGLDWVTFGMLEFGANIVLFMPIGACLLFFVGGRRWWLAVILGALLSVAIEAAQLVLPGVPALRDVLSNSLGTMLGALLGLLVSSIAARRRRGATQGSAQHPESEQAALLE